MLYMTCTAVFIDSNNIPLEARIIHKNKKDPNVNILSQLLMQSFSLDDHRQLIEIERSIGNILGYAQRDIDFYIQRLEARFLNNATLENYL